MADSEVHSPIPAEHAFLILASRWHELAQAAGTDRMLPSDADILALSCLRLAVEWGSEFTDRVDRQSQVNRVLLEDRGSASWIDQLPWDLCRASIQPAPSESGWVELLVESLDHHNSSIRRWMMELGWTAHRWLDPQESNPRLLKNVADTLGFAVLAVGLAAKLSRSDDEFWTQAEDFAPPSGFEDQYQTRLDYAREHSILCTQAAFLTREAECRRIIGEAVFGQMQRTQGSQSSGEGERSESAPGQQSGISKEMARQVVASYLASKTHFGGAPNIYGVDLSDCWIVYLERMGDRLMLRSSEIVAVSKRTGEIVYAGSAHDEG